MSRVLKRVALDFDWPLQKIWEGYINPHYKPCSTCKGKGEVGPEPELLTQFASRLTLLAEASRSLPEGYRPLSELLTPIESPVKRWVWDRCPVEVLETITGETISKVDKRRVMAIARLEGGTPLHYKPRVYRERREYYPHPYLCEDGISHPGKTFYKVIDKIEGYRSSWMGDRCSIERALWKEMGWDDEVFDCPTCKGEGLDPEMKTVYDSWEPFEPRAGEGYQIWSTSCEGCPVSPVFKTPEELARYMEKNGQGLDRGTSYEDWLKFIKGPGESVGSFVFFGDQFKSGVSFSVENLESIPYSLKELALKDVSLWTLKKESGYWNPQEPLFKQVLNLDDFHQKVKLDPLTYSNLLRKAIFGDDGTERPKGWGSIYHANPSMVSKWEPEEEETETIRFYKTLDLLGNTDPYLRNISLKWLWEFAFTNSGVSIGDQNLNSRKELNNRLEASTLTTERSEQRAVLLLQHALLLANSFEWKPEEVWYLARWLTICLVGVSSSELRLSLENQKNRSRVFDILRKELKVFRPFLKGRSIGDTIYIRAYSFSKKEPSVTEGFTATGVLSRLKKIARKKLPLGDYEDISGSPIMKAREILTCRKHFPWVTKEESLQKEILRLLTLKEPEEVGWLIQSLFYSYSYEKNSRQIRKEDFRIVIDKFFHFVEDPKFERFSHKHQCQLATIACEEGQLPFLYLKEIINSEKPTVEKIDIRRQWLQSLKVLTGSNFLEGARTLALQLVSDSDVEVELFRLMRQMTADKVKDEHTKDLVVAAYTTLEEKQPKLTKEYERFLYLYQ